MSCRSRTSLLYQAKGRAMTTSAMAPMTSSVTRRGSTGGRIRDEGRRQKDEGRRQRAHSWRISFCLHPSAFCLGLVRGFGFLLVEEEVVEGELAAAEAQEEDREAEDDQLVVADVGVE